MKYRRKEQTVEAVRYLGNGNTETTPPDWMIEALEEGTLKATNGSDPFMLKLAEHEYQVCAGDYIIRKDNGVIVPAKGDAFEKEYEPIKESSYRDYTNNQLAKLMTAVTTAFLPESEELEEPIMAVAGDPIEAEHVVGMICSRITQYRAIKGALILQEHCTAVECDQMKAVKDAYKLIGAPGDWGRSTPRGKFWAQLLNTYNSIIDERNN